MQRISSQAVATLLILLVCGGLVLYPVVFLVEEALNVGDPQEFPLQEWGLGNFAALGEDWHILANTALVACLATVMAVIFGFVVAWILTRTRVPGGTRLERLMELPYYMTPLVGALAWAILASPRTGFLNQLWHRVGGSGDLFDIYSPFGIAWVMALFEGTVAFVMISAAMKSMDPSLEETSRVLGAGKLRTVIKVTLPLVMPGVLGATIFVFAEMLGSFAAAYVLGIPGRYYVITTAIWQATTSYPPDYGRAAAMGISLFAVMLVSLTIYRLIVRRGNYATITGKAFRPRAMDVGRAAWVLLAVCCAYILVAVVLPLAALLLTSFQRFATVIVDQMQFTVANYENAVRFAAVRSALVNSLVLGFGVATVGAVVMTVLVWIIYRSRAPGHGLIEYVAMFPQAVPRLVFGLALLWAWLNIPIPIYGTLWLLALAYFTVLMPLGVRTLAGVMLQIDKSLEECARVCGASWGYQLRTVTMPLLRPGIVAAWLLLFIASVRELGVSIFLVGPNAQVIAPSIASAWLSSSTELSTALAIIQTAAVFVALAILFRATRRFSGGIAVSEVRIEVSDLVVRYGGVVAVDGVSFTVGRGEHLTLLGPSGCGKTTTLRAIAGLEEPSSGAIRIDGRAMYSSAEHRNIPSEKRGVSMVFQSYAIWPHMNVFDNVAYGLRVRKLPRAEVAENVERALGLVQMREFARRPASNLSGGQQQRVALARAVAFSPTVVLFDEPLSNLDAKLRAEMRVELRELQRRLDITSVYVTHDQEEALAISDRVIVMSEGRIEQIGTPEAIYNRPKSRFVADFVGSANLIGGRLKSAPNGPGPVLFETEGGILLQARAAHPPRGDEDRVAVRTAYIDLAAGPPNGEPNAAAGKIRQRLFHGDFIQYIVDWPAGQLIVRRPPTEMFEEGATVAISFAAEHCVLLEA